jgi:tetratricopeptide (TPR) repeat protein
LKSSRQQAALVEMKLEMENARAAWNWAVEQGQGARLDQAIDGLCLFYEWRGRYQEGETVCRMATNQFACEKLTTAVAGDGQRVWAKTLAWQGTFSHSLGRTKLGGQLLEQCLTLLEGLELANQDVRSEKAFALVGMGIIVKRSDLEEAGRLFKESLALFRALGDHWGMAYHALDLLGDIAVDLGDYDQAKQCFEESLAIGQALGDQRIIAESLEGLSYAAYAQGQLEEAERLRREIIPLRHELDEQPGIADGLYNLGVTLLWLGKFAEAHSLIEESVAMEDDLGSRRALAFWTTSLGFPELHRGRYEAARIQGQRGLTLARETDHRQAIGLSCCLLGEVALAEGAYAEATRLLQESVTECEAIGQQRQLGWTLADLGYAARGMGQLNQARRHLYEALRMAAENRTFIPLITGLPAVALLLADQGEEERAVELYTLALRHGHVANSRWFEDVVGRHIATVAATLPPDVVAAAQERGKARDLWTTAEGLLVELSQTLSHWVRGNDFSRSKQLLQLKSYGQKYYLKL